MKHQARLAGPARKYRHDPARYEAVRRTRWSPTHVSGVTRLGCRDAIVGQKDPYKPAAQGHISAYREGYRICDAIAARRRLTSAEAHVAALHDLKFEIKRARRARR